MHLVSDHTQLIREMPKCKKRHDGLSNLNNLDEHNLKGSFGEAFSYQDKSACLIILHCSLGMSSA